MASEIMFLVGVLSLACAVASVCVLCGDAGTQYTNIWPSMLYVFV